MPDPNPQALQFLLTRRSHPARTLRAPYPDRAALTPILTAAARTPDHGKLEPWRFIVLQGDALPRLAELGRQRGAALGLSPEVTAKMVAQFTDSGCIVAVVQVPRSTEKVPLREQDLSTGAVCLSLLNAALASGWGANWLTGWGVYDAEFCAAGLGLTEGERVAGLIHIGTASAASPDRPRPDLDAVTDWQTA